jgi:hypothetical protein
MFRQACSGAGNLICKQMAQFVSWLKHQGTRGPDIAMIGQKQEGPPLTICHGGPLYQEATFNSTCDDIDDRNIRNVDAGNNGDDSNMLE